MGWSPDDQPVSTENGGGGGWDGGWDDGGAAGGGARWLQSGWSYQLPSEFVQHGILLAFVPQQPQALHAALVPPWHWG